MCEVSVRRSRLSSGTLSEAAKVSKGTVRRASGGGSSSSSLVAVAEGQARKVKPQALPARAVISPLRVAEEVRDAGS